MAIFKSRKKSASASLQTKTATADTDDILVIPDTGYDGMSSVTVHPTPSETKTVTATTSQQTVTPTSGKYMSEVTVNPQAHTTTYTPSEDTASNDMGANHDYRYVDTSGMITPTGTKSITSNGTGIDVAEYAEVDVNVPTVTPTSITPSNSSPVALSANTPVNPTANGYAIASYDTIFPMAVNPEQIEDGKIYQATSNGYAIGNYPFEMYPSNDNPHRVYEPNYYQAWGDGYVIESYNSVTPSSTPTSVSSGDIVKIGGSGVIVDSIPTPTSITPSNSSPVALSANTPVNPTASGYAISSYSSKTPSDSSPASVSSGAIIKANGSGYLYKSSGLGKCAAGSFTASTSTTTTVNLGFQPKYIATYHGASTSSYGTNVYNEDVRSGYVTYASTSSSQVWSQLPDTNTNRIASITSTGFIMNKVSTNATNVRYFAVG